MLGCWVLVPASGTEEPLAPFAQHSASAGQQHQQDDGLGVSTSHQRLGTAEAERSFPSCQLCTPPCPKERMKTQNNHFRRTMDELKEAS